MVVIASRYLLRSDWTLADDWGNTNCIIHGAMSITGLAIVASGALPPIWAVVTWVWVVATFIMVEALEVVRAFVRVRSYGWGGGLSVYNPTQWSRNFTYGMLYGFTLQLNRSPVAPDGWATGLQEAILNYGQYVVLAFLLIEVGLFLFDRIGTGLFSPKTGSTSPQ